MAVVGVGVPPQEEPRGNSILTSRAYARKSAPPGESPSAKGRKTTHFPVCEIPAYLRQIEAATNLGFVTLGPLTAFASCSNSGSGLRALMCPTEPDAGGVAQDFNGTCRASFETLPLGWRLRV